VASLSVRSEDGQFIEVEISRKQLDELALSVGDQVALRLPPEDENDVRVGGYGDDGTPQPSPTGRAEVTEGPGEEWNI
jgi:hypothetical protein